MPPIERDAPVDPLLRHSHSASSDQGRALIPISDPDRAPPPLPLNPQSPTVRTSRSGTSSAIQSAHAALQEKARESALVPTLAKRMSDLPPAGDRALIPRGTAHKRMQSLQPTKVQDLSLMLEGPQRRDSNPDNNVNIHNKYSRPSTPVRNREHDREKTGDTTVGKENNRPGTPSSMPGSLTPLVRPSVRRPPHSILGENTPPQSATMLALQNMQSASSRETSAAPSDSPLANVTNNSTAVVKQPASWDNFSHQMITLTNIATALQKEMTLLSRRSRDNATDLMSLKEATHARDEDIRKSLRDIVAYVDPHRSARDPYGGGQLHKNDGQLGSPMSKAMRPFSLPRIPSPNSFAASLDRDSLLSTPSLVGGGGESPATMALLEKIIREMGTKDGQENLLSHLTELAEKLSGMASSVKVEELIQQLKSTSQELALVHSGGGRGGGGGGGGNGRPRNFSFDDDDDHDIRGIDWNHPDAGPVAQRLDKMVRDKEGSKRFSPPPSSHASDVLSDDVIKVIRGVKDSVAQSGGLTAEVKALVRELRGEVLGMGREIGRRLDESDAKNAGQKTESASKNQVEKIVGEGLEQMSQHLNELLKEHRKSSAASMKAAIDYNEVYNAIRAALDETNKTKSPDLNRENVMQAVKEAWENYKPDITVEHIGLDRDEVLACLKEGLQEYTPRNETPSDAATRDDVIRAVAEGLKHFSPPKVDTPANLTREEILDAVRECLEEFEFPVAPSAMNNDLTREDMLEAVKQGLQSFDFPPTANAVVPHTGGVDGSEVMERLHDIMQFLREEFNAVSHEAKQNVSANGRDTEQVLDATKDGFEQLRAHLEAYVDRAGGSSDQDGMMEHVVKTLDGFRDELADIISKASDGSGAVLKEEIESLRDTVNSWLVPHRPPIADNRDIIEALREGLERVRAELMRPHAGTTDILDALHEGFGDLKISIEKMSNKPADLTANDEILDALKTGLDGVRTNIDSLRDDSQNNQNDRAVATIGAAATPTDLILPADILKHDDIKNLEVMLTQLRIKVEAIEPPPPGPASDGVSKDDLTVMEEMLRNLEEKVSNINTSSSGGLSKDDLDLLEEMLRNVQGSAANLTPPKRESSITVNLEDAASKEDVQAIETILRNAKARLDDMVDGEQAVRKDHVDALETVVLETKESLSLLATSIASQLEAVSKKDDIVAVESVVTAITTSLDEMKERAEKSLTDPERVTKTDVDAVEAVCLDVKTVIEQMLKSDIAALPSKEDIKSLDDAIKEAKAAIDSQAATNAKEFEERQAETVGVGERVTEVKTFLEEFQTLIKEKLEGEATGIEALSKTLETLGETINKNSNVSDDLKEMFTVMKTEFEDSKSAVVGAKLDADEKLQAAADSLGSKIDERIGELMTKYDDFQLVMDDRAKAGEARDVEMEAAVVGTKAVTDDLKLLVDTLGSTVTESMEKMEEASKTVFNRVEELFSKSEENHSDDKNEHSITRDQVKAAVTVVEGLQGQVVEYQPKILETVKDVLLVVGQHYEHSKSTVMDLQKTIEDVRDKEPELPMLPPPEKYDDSEMHSKLDKLIDHTHAAGKAYSQLDTLDKVHAQVVQTAADISKFLEAQTKRIEEDHEDREKTLQETNVALAVAQKEKEHVESNVLSLRTEEEQLRESILALRTEQEFLTRQKTRLTADVSSLETAMQIRREELQAMESRAEGLERRILEGVLDHSRALLMTKSGTKGRDAMSRKRVPGTRSSLTPVDASALNAQTHRKAVNIAVNGGRASLIPPNPAGAAARRILSLSQITSNVPAGGIKRSQSVRTAGGAKSSWVGGAGSAAKKKYGELDKENEHIAEMDETEDDDDSGSGSVSGDEDGGSDAGTLRKSSLGTTVVTASTTTEGDGGYSDEDDGSEDSDSVVGTESVSGDEVVVYGT